MELRLILMALFCLCFVQVAFAVQDRYEFANERQQRVFERLVKRTRCMVCANQSLHESSASLALEIKEFMHARILAGGDESELIAELRAGYGDGVFFAPPVNMATLGLWFGPWLVLGIGVVIYRIYVRRDGGVVIGV